MLEFPDLPSGQWPLNVHNAFLSLRSLYTRAQNLIAQNDTDDVLRFRVAAEDINNEGETLLGLEDHGLPLDWVYEVILCLAMTREALLRVVDGIQKGYVSPIQAHNPC